jgi:hypothetical protein
MDIECGGFLSSNLAAAVNDDFVSEAELDTALTHLYSVQVFLHDLTNIKIRFFSFNFSFSSALVFLTLLPQVSLLTWAQMMLTQLLLRYIYKITECYVTQ